MIARKTGIISFGILVSIFVLVACSPSQPATTPTSVPTETSAAATTTISVEAPTATPTTEQVTEWDYVALGDSRTRRATWPETWANYIEADQGITVNLNNWAFNGQPSEELLVTLRENENLRNDIRQAEVITLLTTDETGQNATLFYENLEECPNEAYKGILDEIVGEIISLRGGESTLFRMIEHYNFPGPTERAMEHFEAKKRCIQIYNQIVHSTADRYGIPVVPLFEAFNGPDGDENPDDKGYLSDGIHTSPEGDLVIADLLRELGYDTVTP